MTASPSPPPAEPWKELFDHWLVADDSDFRFMDDEMSILEIEDLGDAFRAGYDAALAAQAEKVRELTDALKYARRFLNTKDHDTAFVDKALARAHEGETGK